MPPKKPAPWKGVRHAFELGPISPQLLTDSASGDYVALVNWDQQPGGMGEDCLTLNVWTPGIKDGGSVRSWSCSTAAVSPTARVALSVMTAIPWPASATSSSPSTIVWAASIISISPAWVHLRNSRTPALQWVRDNIENFGGDPNTVMIFGQSGGGAKTSCLMAMPSAKGLFHRAAVQSGSLLRARSRGAATAIAEKLLKQLGIDKTRIAEPEAVLGANP